MEGVTCNIDRNDRINRTVIGALLVLGALIGLGRGFMIVVGILMIVSGVVGWCTIPLLAPKVQAKLNEMQTKKPDDQPK